MEIPLIGQQRQPQVAGVIVTDEQGVQPPIFVQMSMLWDGCPIVNALFKKLNDLEAQVASLQNPNQQKDNGGF